jgi:hypothetical protein
MVGLPDIYEIGVSQNGDLVLAAFVNESSGSSSQEALSGFDVP